MPSNHLIRCCPPLLLPFIFPRISIFSNESTLRIWWPKYCSFSINPSSEYSSLISFRIDQFDLLGVQGTLKNLLQHQSLKKNILLILVKIRKYLVTLYLCAPYSVKHSQRDRLENPILPTRVISAGVNTGRLEICSLEHLALGQGAVPLSSGMQGNMVFLAMMLFHSLGGALPLSPSRIFRE